MSGTGASSPDDPTTGYLDALQATLAAEHAAVYVLAYLGAQTSTSAQPDYAATLREAYETHRARRDALATSVREEGGDPVAAAAAYDVEDVTGRPDAVTAQAVEVEQGCSRTYRFLVASSEGEQRRAAISLLLDSAVRSLALGAGPSTFPGS